MAATHNAEGAKRGGQFDVVVSERLLLDLKRPPEQLRGLVVAARSVEYRRQRGAIGGDGGLAHKWR